MSWQITITTTLLKLNSYLFKVSFFEAAKASMQRKNRCIFSKDMFLFGFLLKEPAQLMLCRIVYGCRMCMHGLLCTCTTQFWKTNGGIQFTNVRKHFEQLFNTFGSKKAWKAQYTFFHFPQCMMSGLCLVFFRVYAAHFCTKGAHFCLPTEKKNWGKNSYRNEKELYERIQLACNHCIQRLQV